jgi:hypothetical protein
MTDDPLDAAFVSDEDVIGDSRALLAKMIVPFAAIRSESGEVSFKDEADRLSAKHKILVLLLCRTAYSLRNNKDTVVPTKATEIEGQTGLPGGTVRPRLKALFDERIATRSEDGYWVPQLNIKRAYRQLEPVLPKA